MDRQKTIYVEAEWSDAKSTGKLFMFRTVAVPDVGEIVSFGLGNEQIAVRVTRRDWIVDEQSHFTMTEFRCVLVCEKISAIQRLSTNHFS